MRIIFTLLLSLLTISFSFAKQTNGSIKGVVKTLTGKGIVAATVSLFKAKDSSLVKTEVTESNGEFVLSNIESNTYFIEVSNIGFTTYTSENFHFNENILELKPIVLQEANKELAAVKVIAKKPMIEIKADKMVFNVENSITAQGSTALELLGKSPGIQVDNNENITMKGKTGVRIYIDGRMMQLDTKDLAAYLKSINSNDIEAIEMISNPSAKYDASGNAGIINIKLKKNKRFGTNGSVNMGLIQGITPKANGSVNINYRNKKINIFSNVSGNLSKNENTIDLYRIQNDTLFDQFNTNWDNNKSLNFKTGADFFINSKSTIGILATSSFGDNYWKSVGTTRISENKTGVFTRNLKATNDVPGSRTNANFNFNYKYADTSGREVNFDADYGLFRGVGRSTQPNYYFDKNNNQLYSILNGNHTPTDINIYTSKIDAEQKAGSGKLGYGAKYAIVETKNAFSFFLNSALVKSRSSSFKYIEKVAAAYANYNQQLNAKWSLQLGLRAEQTNSDGKLTRADGLVQNDARVKRSYLNFFPSGAVTFNASEKNTWNLTYSHRIDRPTYQDLNPFENKLDELTYEKGNAFLQPQYTDNITFTHTFKSMINTSIGYSYIKDYATQVFDTTNKTATYVQVRNFASQQIYSFNIGSPLPIKSWWNGYVNIWFNYQMFNGKFGSNVVDLKLPQYGIYMQHSFNLNKKGLNAEISGWYNGKSNWGTAIVKPMGAFDIGFSKPVLKEKGTLKFSVTDVLWSSKWRMNNQFGGVNISGTGTNESRTLRLNFNYRFGSNQVKNARERQTGLESEKGRIK